MHDHDDQCDAQLLDALLSGQIDDGVEQRIVRHLDHCRECRTSLDSRSAELQQETSRLLREQPFDADSRFEFADAIDETIDQSMERTSHSILIRGVLDSLGPTDDPAMLGRLGGYEVSGVVGAGGMGVVLKALDRSLDRTVAIKVLAPHLACSGAARTRFAREAKAAAAVLHPNVIAIHGVSSGDHSSSLPYLVMPYLRGSSLQLRIDREGPLTVAEILRVASQIVAGLAAAHAQGLVHRDIKPANILLEEGIERVSITDFGLARAVDDATLTRSGVIAGTPQYMSPEQARGEPIDARSDLFSLGSVIYTMCTGHAPFRAETSYGILRRITDQSPRPIREINADLPVWLCRLVDKLHAKSPDDRYQSATVVAEVVQQCLAHVQTPNAKLPRELQRSPPLAGIVRRPIATITIGLLAVSLLIAAFLLWPAGGSGKVTTDSHNQPVPEQQTSLLPDTSWQGADEPSMESVQRLIESLEVDTRRSFDHGP